jgi:CBS-domain-containing membrane protein
MRTAKIVSSKKPTYLMSRDPLAGNAEDVPAIDLMTDFLIDAPATVSVDRHIDAALNDMIVAGVRALVVLHEGKVAGLITASDILGEKPVKFLQDPLCTGNPCTRREIVVGNIMSYLGWLETLELKWVEKSTAGDLASIFASNSLTHMLVMEPGNIAGIRSVRGLMSRTQLERHLGAPTPMFLG